MSGICVEEKMCGRVLVVVGCGGCGGSGGIMRLEVDNLEKNMT